MTSNQYNRKKDRPAPLAEWNSPWKESRWRDDPDIVEIRESAEAFRKSGKLCVLTKRAQLELTDPWEPAPCDPGVRAGSIRARAMAKVRNRRPPSAA